MAVESERTREVKHIIEQVRGELDLDQSDDQRLERVVQATLLLRTSHRDRILRLLSHALAVLDRD